MKRLNNILIIDDDPVFAKLMRKSIQRNTSKSVQIYSKPFEILKKNNETPPQLIYLDYKMKDLNGLSTAKVLRKKWRKTTIILISESANIVKINLSRYGINYQIQKDLGPYEVAQKGLNYLKKRQLKRLFKILMFSIFAVIAVIIIYQLLN